MSIKTGHFFRPSLDVVRFIAFVLVFVAHALLRFSDFQIRQVSLMVDTGCFGLCLFFMLSAYLITLLLLRERTFTGGVQVRSFYLRRMLRIWPLYLGALVGAAIYHQLHHDIGRVLPWLLGAAFMIGNIIKVASIMRHLWSISIEEQFYLVWPSAMSRLSRSGLVTAAYVLVALSLATLLRFGLIGAEAGRVWTNTFVQFGFFGGGILLAVFDEKRPELPTPVAVLGTGGGLLLFYVASAVVRVMDPGAGPLRLMTGYSLAAFACGLVIVSVQSIHGWPRPLVYLGKISYGLYVFHVPALEFVAGYLPRHSQIVHWTVSLLLTIVASVLSYRYFESPFLRLKRKFEVIKARPV